MATTASSIRAYLDSLSQLPGSILVRNELSWQGLPPGNAGQVLTLDDDGYPSWQYGAAYNPPLQLFNGTTGRFTGQYTSIGNQETLYALIQRDPFTGGGAETAMADFGPGTNNLIRRSIIQVGASDHPTPELRNKAIVAIRSTAPALLYLAASIQDVADGSRHLIGLSFNASAPAATFEIDGEPADNLAWSARVPPATGTMNAGASSNFYVGSLGTAQFFAGKMGMTGLSNTFLSTFANFPTDPNRIFKIDTDTWPQWQGIPAYWSPFAAMDSNEGAAPNMVRNATVTLVTA